MLKFIVYLIVSLATIFYALPRIHPLSNDLLTTVFAFVWIGFAVIIVGAHLDQLLYLDEKKKKRLTHLKKYRIWQKEQQILNMQSSSLKRLKEFR